jgi:hypothetical protein
MVNFLFSHVSGWMGDNERKCSVGIVDLQIEVRTQDFLNTKEEYY